MKASEQAFYAMMHWMMRMQVDGYVHVNKFENDEAELRRFQSALETMGVKTVWNDTGIGCTLHADF